MDKHIHIISVKNAREKGLKRYFTAMPCKHGHIAERFTRNRECLECYRIRKPEADRKYNKKNKDKIKEKSHARYMANRDSRLSDCKDYYQKNKERIKDRASRYYQKNRARVLKQHSEYRKLNRSKSNKYFRDRRKNDPDYSVKCSMRTMLKRCASMQPESKRKRRTEEYLGYTAKQLRDHLEKQFAKGMGWHNRGEWHIDHIIPISVMIEQGVTDPKKINCLSNLKPVWAKDNLSKGSKQEELI